MRKVRFWEQAGLTRLKTRSGAGVHRDRRWRRRKSRAWYRWRADEGGEV